MNYTSKKENDFLKSYDEGTDIFYKNKMPAMMISAGISCIP